MLHSHYYDSTQDAQHDSLLHHPMVQEAAGWEAALDQAGRHAGEAAPGGQTLPDSTAPAADGAAAQLSGASASALAALRAAEAEATRAAVLKARACTPPALFL